MLCALTEFAHAVLKVEVCSAFADAEDRGSLPSGLPPEGPLKHLDLSRGQLDRDIRCRTSIRRRGRA